MPTAPDPIERSYAAAAAAHRSWAATTDRSARTAPARAGLWRKFLDEADGDPVRATHLWKAHFAQLGMKAAKARRRAREQAELASAADEEINTLGGDEVPQ